MTAILKVEEAYIEAFESFISALPKGAVVLTPIKRSLDKELRERIDLYERGEMKTTPLEEGLSELRRAITDRL